MEEFKELELKFSANKVKLPQFVELMESLKFSYKKEAHSFDTYYTHKTELDSFLRFRESECPELTIKQKTQMDNNFNRIEVDLPLDKSRINKFIVDKWADLEGYQFNFKIFKNCFIYYIENVNFVYYITFSENMEEKGRFIEIEYDKSKVSEVGEVTAFEELKKYEQLLIKLGITPQNRLKKSLFELYRSY